MGTLNVRWYVIIYYSTTPSAVTRVSQCYQYDKGLEQCFKQSSVTLSPSNWNEDKLNYNPDDGQTSFPVAILLETQPSGKNMMDI